MAQLQHGATCRTRLIANACCHLVAARQHSMRMGSCPRMDESIGLVPVWCPPPTRWPRIPEAIVWRPVACVPLLFDIGLSRARPLDNASHTSVTSSDLRDGGSAGEQVLHKAVVGHLQVVNHCVSLPQVPQDPDG